MILQPVIFAHSDERHDERGELSDGIEQGLELDLRDVSVSFSPLDTLDVKLGRQVLTWGTGDLVFLNDLFPKDWVSFFAGRDDEYLKAPSNSVRLTQYNPWINIDFVWTPRFTPDEYIRGNRFAFFSPFDGSIVGGAPSKLTWSGVSLNTIRALPASFPPLRSRVNA